MTNIMPAGKQSFLTVLLSGPFATIFASVMTTFIVAAFFFKLSGPVPISVTQTTVEKEKTFDAVGEGRAVTMPDQAKVNLGVRIEQPSVLQAQKKVNQTTNGIVKALKDLGISDQDIKTISYAVSPKYDYRQERKITAYEASATIEVKLDDFDRLNQAVDTAAGLGANQIGDIRFTLSEEKQKQIRKEARKKAVSEAKQKAEELASLAGIKLGKVLNVSEETQRPYPRPIYLDKEAAGEALPAEPTQIEPGSAQLIIRVTLSYETL